MKKIHHPEFFEKHPESATTCLVIDRIIRKLEHTKKHYKNEEEKEFIAHLQESHTMLEDLLKDVLKEQKSY